MRKNIQILLAIFSIFIYSQRKMDDSIRSKFEFEIECDKQNKRDKIIYDKLKKESEEIDFSDLTKVIIDDLDISFFRADNVLITMEFSNLECGVIDEFYECEKKYNLVNPFYNYENWASDDLKYLSKRLKKNVIPYKVASGFGRVENYYWINNEENRKFKKLKVGINDDVNKKFYYASQTNDILHVDYNTIYDKIYFHFQNLLDYKVKTTVFINDKKVIKTYQFENEKWILTKN